MDVSVSMRLALVSLIVLGVSKATGSKNRRPPIAAPRTVASATDTLLPNDFLRSGR